MRQKFWWSAGLAVCAAAASPAPAQTQTDMNASAGQAAKAADQALNAQYKATTAKLSVPSRTLLRNAQRSWIGFRDQQCKFEASGVQGGSAYPMVLSGCLKRLTDDRTRQLKALGQCQEGDLSCPR
jgi:uncharacterized protein YecT (DUF1311 family)